MSLGKDNKKGFFTRTALEIWDFPIWQRENASHRKVWFGWSPWVTLSFDSTHVAHAYQHLWLFSGCFPGAAHFYFHCIFGAPRARASETDGAFKRQGRLCSIDKKGCSLTSAHSFQKESFRIVLCCVKEEEMWETHGVEVHQLAMRILGPINSMTPAASFPSQQADREIQEGLKKDLLELRSNLFR